MSGRVISGTPTSNVLRFFEVHLRDHYRGPGSDLIQITVNGHTTSTKLPKETDRLFQFLSQVATEKPAIQKVLLHIARNEGFE